MKYIKVFIFISEQELRMQDSVFAEQKCKIATTTHTATAGAKVQTATVVDTAGEKTNTYRQNTREGRFECVEILTVVASNSCTVKVNVVVTWYNMHT